MAGTITHKWNGTILEITSDSGTSAADLKGSIGDTGPRGPRGLPNENDVDLSNYYTKEETDAAINAHIPDIDVDMTGYATEQYVNDAIAAIPPIDLSAYYTELETKGYVLNQVSKCASKADIADFITIEDVEDKGYQTAAQVEAAINTAIVENDNNSIPQYVIEEVEAVAEKLLDNRTPNSITLIMASDFHIDKSNEESVSAITDLGFAMEELKKRIRPDAYIMMGDYVDDATQDAINGKDDIQYIYNATIAATIGTPTIWLNGNHDGIWDYTNNKNILTPNEVYSYIGAKTNVRDAVIDHSNIHRNYGYVDYPHRKIRLIWMNTSDNSSGETTYNCLTNTQLNWIINNALDMTSKGEDESNWGIVSMAHIPIQTITSLKDILDAYKGRKSGSTTANGGAVSYNFTNVKAQHLVHFNGHTHNLYSANYGENNVLQVGIPNACPYNQDTYSMEDTDYPKTQGTKDSTAFCVVSINRDEKKVKAYCYGAGYDRELEWSETASYTNHLDTNDANFATNQRLSSSGTTKGQDGSFVSGYIKVKNGDVIRVYAPECNYNTYTASYPSMAIYKADKSLINVKYAGTNQPTISSDTHSLIYTLGSDTADGGDNIAFIRVGGQPANAANVIITINEEII